MQTTIRRRSKKRAKQEREYLKLRDWYLSRQPTCEVKGCNCQSTEIHHKKGRVGDLLTDIRFFLAVCWVCHVYIETQPLWAKERGYSLSRLSKTETL